MKYDAVFFAFLLSVLAEFVWSHQARNPLNGQGQDAHAHKAPSGGNRGHTGNTPPERREGHQGGSANVMDRNAVHDEEHIKEHLDGKVDTKEKYTDEEMQFHYFKLHDYDDNNMLDGLEIIAAITHRHREHGGGSPDEHAEKQPAMSEQEISESVDSILQDNDANRDGYIDYPEFIIAQRTDER